MPPSATSALLPGCPLSANDQQTLGDIALLIWPFTSTRRLVLTLANASSLGVPNPMPQQIGREVFSPGRLNTQFDDIYQLQNSARSTYNGISFALNRWMSDELAFSASYTLSKTFDDASDFGCHSLGSVPDEFLPERASYAPFQAELRSAHRRCEGGGAQADDREH